MRRKRTWLGSRRLRRMVGNESSEPWAVEMITLEYSVTGTVDVAANKWAWSYFTQTTRPAGSLDVAVTDIHATGAMLPPDLRGRTASFHFGTGLVALVAKNDAAIAVWEKWNGSNRPLAGFALIGPYSLSGWFASQDGTIGSPIMASVFPVRDATLTRIDGSGAGFTSTMPRAMISSAFVHTIVPTG